MNESQFNQQLDALFLDVEDALDASGAELDYENSAGVLTITCEDSGTKIILSRQPAISELWIAAKSGGYHLSDHGEDGFVCRVTGETLAELLSRVLTEQSTSPIEISLAP